MSKTVVIAGASGIVGRAAMELFSSRPEWSAIGLSRRPPEPPVGEHIAVDLTDPAACREVSAQLGDVTHLIYTALYEKPGLIGGWLEADQMQTNLDMLRNLMEPLQASASGLRHVSLLQGTKAYGAHVGPMRVPGKEREPRVEHPNFYWLQEDWLKSAQRGTGWSYTLWRPPVILGHAVGAPMNLVAAIGAYLSLCKANGDSAGWPGGTGAPMDVVDADLLAQAMLWATSTDAAANETFNLTNGDVLVWENVWPRLAAEFGLAADVDTPTELTTYFASQADAWQRLAIDEQLVVRNLSDLVGDSDVYADVLWNTGRATPPRSTLLSPIKIRQAGFSGCLDSEDCLVEWLQRLRKMRILPH